MAMLLVSFARSFLSFHCQHHPPSPGDPMTRCSVSGFASEDKHWGFGFLAKSHPSYHDFGLNRTILSQLPEDEFLSS